jgi:hypothetical protein
MTARRPSGFIEPWQPSKVARPPSGPLWVHEIKHDGYRLMVRRDGLRVRCFARNGHWAGRLHRQRPVKAFSMCPQMKAPPHGAAFLLFGGFDFGGGLGLGGAGTALPAPAGRRRLRFVTRGDHAVERGFALVGNPPPGSRSSTGAEH